MLLCWTIVASVSALLLLCGSWLRFRLLWLLLDGLSISERIWILHWFGLFEWLLLGSWWCWRGKQWILGLSTNDNWLWFVVLVAVLLPFVLLWHFVLL